MAKKKLREEVEIPKKADLSFEDGVLKADGPEGSTEKSLISRRIDVSIEGDKAVLTAKDDSQESKRMINSFKSHVKNLARGVVEPYTYKMKICASHFPMNVSVKGDHIEIKNFIGEEVPRKIKIMEGADVKIEDDTITITSCNKERAGAMASLIEERSKRPGFDKRKFQDGIYITEKAGKKI